LGEAFVVVASSVLGISAFSFALALTGAPRSVIICELA